MGKGRVVNVSKEACGRFATRLQRAGMPISVLFALAVVLGGCSNLTGWRIPGTEKGAGATTTVYLVLENVETIPEELRTRGEIFVDDAFFGNTSRPEYYRFVGNELVVGTIKIQKEKIHTVRVDYPNYEPFEHTQFFGTLPEYSVSFRLKHQDTAQAADELDDIAESEKEKTGIFHSIWKIFDE